MKQLDLFQDPQYQQFMRDEDYAVNRDTWVARRTVELMKEKFNPWKYGHWHEAIGEITEAEIDYVSGLEKRDALNRIGVLVEEYWTDLAWKAAELEWDIDNV